MVYTIYGTPTCPACSRAKMLLQMKGLKFDYKEIGSDIQKEKLEEQLGRKISSVPQILKTSDGFSEYIGNYDDLVNSLNHSKN